MWQTSEYPVSDDATLLTMVNMPRFNSFGAYINWSPTFFGCWHPALMAGLQWQDFKISHATEPTFRNIQIRQRHKSSVGRLG